MAIERRLVTASQGLTLVDGEVHIWSASLHQSIDVVERLASSLASDEKARAARFHFERDRNSFIIARGILRVLLARYVNKGPHQITFRYEAEGKPQLSNEPEEGIRFNLSHSNEHVLYAFTRNRKIGIDLEFIRPITDLEEIAARNFSSKEVEQLKSLAPEQKIEGFFNCWTRKEAYIKAIGNGLSFPLQQFDVSLGPGEQAKLLGIRGNEEEAAAWSMCQLPAANGYVAALVVEGNNCSVLYRQWNDFEMI